MGQLRNLTAFAAIYALVACGGSEGGSGFGGSPPTTTSPPTTAQTQTINGISVPLGASEPDTSSLVGKDVNTNGLRDEVEISLARNYGDRKNLHQAVFNLAAFYQTWLQQDVDQAKARHLVDEELRLGKCVATQAGLSRGANSAIVDEVSLRVFSTNQRSAKKAQIYKIAGPFTTSDEEASC